ncbi:50S ribosomal protein L3 [Leptospira ilyithenensis]|uniref:Large ribosomal subunit protein uL3 n=1 Tax=Leptospira ilyithenensis TaxID=2484901 RepID=A0A4R9LMJ1_9LEPT|nr:50S ribosomal protein L3 [Leptospira ilyithenensis]TGN08083.1 50S ribosomal protein L3 [Leptospira ilyithenensis]
MAKGLLAEKLGMAHIFNNEGKMVTVTVLRVGPCFVSQIKTTANDGYEAVQLAFAEAKEKNLSKAELGHLKKASIGAKRHLAEFKGFDSVAVGAELKASDIFALNDTVKVSGTSKGKGTQGVIKRHGFAGGPAGHGSRFQRHPGSIGSNTTPGRVFKGLKMGGRMGNAQSTVRNLKVVKIEADQNLIFVSGSVPGRDTSIVTIEKIGN